MVPRQFYERDAEQVARDLLGCILVHRDGARRRAARIVETEAYLGTHDRACHSSKGRTARTEVMFGPPGHAYVYLIYGIHDCFNVVTGPAGAGAAVLVRAVVPIADCEGEGDGPGKVCRALRITRELNGVDLLGERLFVEAGQAAARIARGPRVGVDYAGAWARRLLRFWVSGEPGVSRAGRTGARRPQ